MLSLVSLVCALGTVECWGGRQGGCGPELCGRRLSSQGVWQPAGCVSCELVCVCVSLVRVVIICPASTHTALVSSPSMAVLHLTTYLPTRLTPFAATHKIVGSLQFTKLPALTHSNAGGPDRGPPIPRRRLSGVDGAATARRPDRWPSHMHLPNRARAPDLSARAQCSPAPPSERRHERRSPHIWPATRPPWRRPGGDARPPGLRSGTAGQNARMRHVVRASVTLAPLFARSLPPLFAPLFAPGTAHRPRCSRYPLS